jgi:glycosyltransferase involved in cell wall biosynthesis
MLFSILIANYNNSTYLKTALESVLAQTYTNWEIILVDDCSTDNFAVVIEEYMSDERIKLYQNGRNRGCGYTKRRCASLANGDILGFLDPDDALQPEALEILCIAHQNNPKASLIHSTHYICNEDLVHVRVAEYPKSLPPGVPYLFLNDGSVHHFASFKKSCYQQTHGISPENKKAVDQDLYYLLEETGSILFINRPLYDYRIHENSISTTGKEWESTLWHYQVIQEACMRRIQQQKLLKNGDKYWIRKYRTHYYKIAIFSNYRNKRWLPFLSTLFIFPFVGGFGNILSYTAKLPKGGIKMIRRSFHYDHQIKA